MGILFIELAIGIFTFSVYLMMGISIGVYSISKIIIGYFFIQELTIYFSFLIMLIFTAYFLEYLGIGFLNILHKIGSKTRYDMRTGYKKIVKLLKPKLWIYLLAVIFTFIASIEKIVQYSIVSWNTWDEVKPYLFESIVTFIALDTFVSLITSNKNFIDESKKLIFSYVTEILSALEKKKENSSGHE